VKTDLFGGFVGDMIDWSQDHIYTNLQMIHSIAPDRVGIYGLVRQDEETKIMRPIYVHSKLAIVDDERIITGSTNMDNMSFFYSSELSVTISNTALILDTKERLLKEHLGVHYSIDMKTDFMKVFNTFRSVSLNNVDNLQNNHPLVARPIAIVPVEYHQLLLQNIYYPTKFSKLLYKMGVNTEDLFSNNKLRVRSAL